MASEEASIQSYYKEHSVPDVIESMLASVSATFPADPVTEMAIALNKQRLDRLNAQFEIQDRVRFAMGQNGMIKVVMQHGDGATDGNICEVAMQGAHVTRWSVGGYDALWVSPDAVYAPGHAIRGGIPLCWPQFGPGPLPQHGFLRTSGAWRVQETDANDQNVTVVFVHEDTDETRKVWDHKFKIEYKLYLKPHTLSCVLKVHNTGTAPLEFTGAFHTYFHVPNIRKAGVEGLNGLTFQDKLQDQECVESNTAQTLAIGGETDRVYLNAPDQLVIHDGFQCRTTLTKSPSLPDAVLWNPWVKKANQMRDFNNYGWRTMLCLEAAAAKKPVVIKPGGVWFGSQTLSADCVQA
eukprot:TRINITY_DN1259_c3_g1_i1.p1 TRINITY_DN1259_c3_g1~~TRINITY_DN1259_c3_g1_i1.p1  ORF type:complete len:378 (+),score=109.18 TRINITY_DN1259_c3_g1_i1:83-1135(+)